MAAKTLAESIRGRHIHSTLPLGATSAVVTQSERKPYSSIGGYGDPPKTGATAEGLVLRIATARLIEGDPVPAEHDAVRWLRAGELDEVTWAAADVPFLAAIRDLLGTPRITP